jgi:hypothetical protein
MSHPKQNLGSQHFVPEVCKRPCDMPVKHNTSDYTFQCPKPNPIKETIDGTANRKLHPLTLEKHFIRDGCLQQGAYIQYMVLPYRGNFRFILLAQFDGEAPFVMYSYTLNARTLHCDVTFEFYEAKTFKAFGHTCNQVITLNGYLVDLVDDQSVIVGQFYYPPFKFRSDRDGKTKRLNKDKSEIKTGDGKKKRLNEKVKSPIVNPVNLRKPIPRLVEKIPSPPMKRKHVFDDPPTKIVRSSIEELEFLSKGPRSPELISKEVSEGVPIKFEPIIDSKSPPLPPGFFYSDSIDDYRVYNHKPNLFSQSTPTPKEDIGCSFDVTLLTSQKSSLFKNSSKEPSKKF